MPIVWIDSVHYGLKNDDSPILSLPPHLLARIFLYRAIEPPRPHYVIWLFRGTAHIGKAGTIEP